MFELKQKITNADVKAVNLAVMLTYFIPYLAASLVGIAVGITATVLRPRTEMLVLGIILIVLGAILLGCAILLVIAPKNFVASALLPDDEVERDIKLTDDNITVSTDGKNDIVIDYYEVTKVKRKNNRALVYIGKEQVLILKDEIASGQTLDELVEFIKSRVGKLLPPSVENKGIGEGKVVTDENAQNAELTDTLVGADDEANAEVTENTENSEEISE